MQFVNKMLQIASIGVYKDLDGAGSDNVEYVLAKDGYEVTSVAGGAEALQLLESQRFDLIVTDLRMAGVDGMQLLEKAKAADPGVEVIMVSGFATTPAAVEAMKKGSYYFLTKPFQLDELRDMVSKALLQKKTRLGGKGPILCFVGPPGTGKTSLQQSIAHIPAGAIPKDGPSAGLTIAVSLVSLLTRRPVQLDMAFTGELTLGGRILPVGGIKEKILAARRAGITKIVLPLRNKVDLYDIPANVTKDIEIIVTDEINKVIELALGSPVL